MHLSLWQLFRGNYDLITGYFYFYLLYFIANEKWVIYFFTK